MNIVSGFMDTRTNREDFAITPYLFSVVAVESIISVYGIGLCWGWYSAYIGIGFNIPAEIPKHKVVKFNKSE